MATPRCVSVTKADFFTFFISFLADIIQFLPGDKNLRLKNVN